MRFLTWINIVFHDTHVIQNSNCKKLKRYLHIYLYNVEKAMHII